MTDCAKHEWMTPLPRRHDYCKHCGAIKEEPACTECSRLASRVERLENAFAKIQEQRNKHPLTNGICVVCGGAYDHYRTCVLAGAHAEGKE